MLCAKKLPMIQFYVNRKRHVPSMKRYHSGFTLVEMMLVLVIISMILVMSIGYMQQKTLTMRINRTSAQMQQILNAAMAYYVSNGAWPANVACLQGTGSGCSQQYLPKVLKSPWGQSYDGKSLNAVFYAWTPITTGNATTANSYATSIAGGLPLAYATKDYTPPNQVACSTSTCYVVATVNIPGQTLNTATAVNFAGTYTHGGCVPVPECPVDKDGTTMIPTVIIVPISVSGVSYQGDSKIYPINSFTGYAMGNTPLDTTPPLCTNSTSTWPTGSTDCTQHNTGTPVRAYWRACLQIITTQGDVSVTNDTPGETAWGQNARLMAFTRCSVKDESKGTEWTVFSN